MDVDGRQAWIPEAGHAALAAPPDPPAVRLLPPSDPFLQARDRELLAPDPAHRKVLWPILGRPGALLVEGDVAGTWRARKKGRRIALTVAPFGRLPTAARGGLDEEAALLAAARGATGATVTVD
ncbi:MAG: crosslink repair DNA glycosylase YcaQ family protein [Egibacteraceae bacterium]